MSFIDSHVQAIGLMEDVPTILDVVCRTTGMGFAAVAHVTEDRWIACSVLDNIHFGLQPGDELELESTICHEIRMTRELVVIDNVSESPFRDHHTPARYGFQSYISVPIVLHDGSFFGTLCAIDPAPAKLQTPETIGMFKLFARMIAANLDNNERLTKAQAELAAERQLSEVREQFVAVLGHDLRNPLASLMAGISRLKRVGVAGGAEPVLAAMQSSAIRMRDLVDNVMDFARARLGDGLDVTFRDEAPLAPVLEQVVEEIRSVYPDHDIRSRFDFDRNVPCDHPRVAQLLSNLLGNAVTHGDQQQPIQVGGHTAQDRMELWVTNGGVAISPDAMATLFRPFFRGKVRKSQQGLGLGLYIASEIARVHGGTLTAASDETETRFTFTMPLAPQA